MSATTWATLGAAGAGLLTSIAALWRVLSDKRQGISSNEQAARKQEAENRRDTIADRDAFIDRLEQHIEAQDERIKHIEDRLTAAEDGNVAKALIIRAQDEHMDLLERWIWEKREPPPPTRPDIVREHG